MKVLIAVKRVIDPYVKIRIKADGSGIETQNVKMSIDPFTEIALEEAIRLKENGVASELVAVSIGSELCQDVLRHALALGADRAILVRTEQQLCSLNIAKVLQKIVLTEQPDLILMGKQSTDRDNNQTPQMLAALLDWPQATYASSIKVNSNYLEVEREIDGGITSIKVTLPAVVSTDLRLNVPRYASLPNIMKAKKKTIDLIDLPSLNLSLKDHINIISVVPPEGRSAGIILNSVEQLVDKLQHEAQVL